MLAMLGWNDGTEQEIFTLSELSEKFTIEKVHKGGARFDFEKAKWFNHEWIKRLPASAYSATVLNHFQEKGLPISDNNYFEKVLDLVKDRCTLLTDFWEHGHFFFRALTQFDFKSIQSKWNPDKAQFFRSFSEALQSSNNWNAASLEELFKKNAEQAGIKPGELQLPLRIMLVGGKFGPPVFIIAEMLGREETVSRINNALEKFQTESI